MCDCEIPKVWEHKIRVARQVHECVECNEPIEIGQQYEYMSALTDGRWYHGKTCLKCRTLHDYLVEFHDADNCYELGALHWEIRQEGYLPDGVYENENEDLRLEDWAKLAFEIKTARNARLWKEHNDRLWANHICAKVDRLIKESAAIANT